MTAMRIRYKLLISFLGMATALIALVGWIGYNQSTKALTSASLGSLKSIREMKSLQIEQYFNRVRQECLALARMDTTIESMKAFKNAFYKVKDELTITQVQLDQYKKALQEYYNKTVIKKFNTISNEQVTFEQLAPNNQNALILQYLYIINYKDILSNAQYQTVKTLDKSTYTQVFSHYAPIFAYLTEQLKIYDIYLVDLETGYVVFETGNRDDRLLEIDFANSITDGGLQDTNLADALEYIKDAYDQTASKLVDFEFYIPSLGTPNAFIAVPIFDGDKKIGALAFELAVDEINAIMTDNRRWKEIGLGNTGESYLIGSDYKMRSISRLLVENPTEYFKVLESLGTDRITLDKIKLYNTSILLQDIRTMQAEAAIRGESGVTIAPDYRGVQVLTAYAPLSIPDVHWGIVSKIDAQEALASVADLGRLLLTVALALLLLVSLYIIPLTRWVTSSIKALDRTITQLTQQHIADAVHIVSPTRGDLGVLTEHLNAYFKRVSLAWQQLKQSTTLFSTALYNLQDHLEALQGIGQVRQHLHDTQELGNIVHQSLTTLEQHRQESVKQLTKLNHAITDVNRAIYYMRVTIEQSVPRESQESIAEYINQVYALLQEITIVVQALLHNSLLQTQTQESTLLYTERLILKIQDAQAQLTMLMHEREKAEQSIKKLFDVRAQIKDLD